MNQNNCILYPFLQAVRGNWRNSIFLQCGTDVCPYGQPLPCEGFLFTADVDGTPLLMPIRYFRMLTGETVSKGECQDVLKRQAFEAIYSRYIEWHTISSKDCPLRQLCQAPYF